MTSNERGPSWSERLNPRNWSLAAKLVAVGLVPTVLALVLGVLRVSEQASDAARIGTASEVLQVRQDVANVSTTLREERNAATLYVAGGRKGDRTALEQAGAATDAKINTLRTSLTGASAVLDGSSTAAESLADGGYTQLPVLRTDVSNINGDVLDDVINRYTAILQRADVLERALIRQSRADAQGGLGDALTATSQASEALALQHSVLAGAIVSKVLTDSGRSAASAADASFTSAFADYQVVLTPAQLAQYGNFATDGANVQREYLRNAVLSSRPVVADLATWDSAYQQAAGAVDRSATAVSAELTNGVRAAQADASNQAGINSVILMLGLLLGIAIIVLLARSLIRSLRVLRHSAMDVAERRLPQAVEDLRAGNPLNAVVEPVPLTGRDEVGQVARAFDAVHGQAVRLAVDQAALQSNVSNMFVNLSRRSQALVERQLQLIEQLESNEQDPDQLSNLFQLDHLATRMRRNSENLLVLAGTDLAKRNVAPVPVVDVLRAAVSEIEQYQRVVVQPPPVATIAGRAASDLVHLLAELLDNATNFSPPDSQVVMATTRANDGSLLVEIADRGVGMADHELSEANQRLDSPAAVDVSASRRMGLFVVGRLAHRHGLGIHLGGATGGGTGGLTASVTVPASLVPTAEQPERRPVPAGARTGGADTFGGPQAFAGAPAAPALPSTVPAQRPGSNGSAPRPLSALVAGDDGPMSPAPAFGGRPPTPPVNGVGLPVRRPGPPDDEAPDSSGSPDSPSDGPQRPAGPDGGPWPVENLQRPPNGQTYPTRQVNGFAGHEERPGDPGGLPRRTPRGVDPAGPEAPQSDRPGLAAGALGAAGAIGAAAAGATAFGRGARDDDAAPTGSETVDGPTALAGDVHEDTEGGAALPQRGLSALAGGLSTPDAPAERDGRDTPARPGAEPGRGTAGTAQGSGPAGPSVEATRSDRSWPDRSDRAQAAPADAETPARADGPDSSGPAAPPVPPSTAAGLPRRTPGANGASPRPPSALPRMPLAGGPDSTRTDSARTDSARTDYARPGGPERSDGAAADLPRRPLGGRTDGPGALPRRPLGGRTDGPDAFSRKPFGDQQDSGSEGGDAPRSLARGPLGDRSDGSADRTDAPGALPRRFPGAPQERPGTGAPAADPAVADGSPADRSPADRSAGDRPAERPGGVPAADRTGPDTSPGSPEGERDEAADTAESRETVRPIAADEGPASSGTADENAGPDRGTPATGSPASAPSTRSWAAAPSAGRSPVTSGADGASSAGPVADRPDTDKASLAGSDTTRAGATGTGTAPGVSTPDSPETDARTPLGETPRPGAPAGTRAAADSESDSESDTRAAADAADDDRSELTGTERSAAQAPGSGTPGSGATGTGSGTTTPAATRSGGAAAEAGPAERPGSDPLSENGITVFGAAALGAAGLAGAAAARRRGEEPEIRQDADSRGPGSDGSDSTGPGSQGPGSDRPGSEGPAGADLPQRPAAASPAGPADTPQDDPAGTSQGSPSGAPQGAGLPRRIPGGAPTPPGAPSGLPQRAAANGSPQGLPGGTGSDAGQGGLPVGPAGLPQRRPGRPPTAPAPTEGLFSSTTPAAGQGGGGQMRRPGGFEPRTPATARPDQTATGPSGSAQSDQTGFEQTGFGQTEPEPTGLQQTGPAQTGFGQAGFGQTDPGRDGLGQSGAAQSEPGQFRAGQFGAGQAGADGIDGIETGRPPYAPSAPAGPFQGGPTGPEYTDGGRAEPTGAASEPGSDRRPAFGAPAAYRPENGTPRGPAPENRGPNGFPGNGTGQGNGLGQGNGNGFGNGFAGPGLPAYGPGATPAPGRPDPRPLGAGALGGPSPQAGFDLGQTTPIFEEIASAWFRSNRSVPVRWADGPDGSGPAPEPEPAPRAGGAFATAADEGWLVADRTATETEAESNRQSETTDAGLPKRRPRAKLVPGSAAGSAVLAPPSGPARNAEAIRGRLASYQQGVRQGRESRLRRQAAGGPGSERTRSETEQHEENQ
ncbi:hypothetical protein GCM10009836_56900 [Pseudonocardia ailaonensis]|uniref:histidine kinase n=1 Tax=Pseudonocardia ailaonensis TaxID=367279 RepID=A0ABN2NJ28_9PSEU